MKPVEPHYKQLCTLAGAFLGERPAASPGELIMRNLVFGYWHAQFIEFGTPAEKVDWQEMKNRFSHLFASLLHIMTPEFHERMIALYSEFRLVPAAAQILSTQRDGKRLAQGIVYH